MRILTQTGELVREAAPRARAAAAVVALLAWGASSSADAAEGQIACALTENGGPARGSLVVAQGGRRIASGSCAKPLSVEAGRYQVTIHLDGALDNPKQTRDATVTDGQTATVAVDFKTGTLEVRIEAQEQRGTGLVVVEKDGRRLGTLGSGVAARLSSGAYQVIVRLGGKEQRHAVDLRPGQRRVVRAQF